MPKTPPQEPPTLHSILDTGNDHSTSALYRSALGGLWSATYLKHFTRMEAHPRPHWRWLGWNWAAAVLTSNWMIYRGMWRGLLSYVSTLLAISLFVLGMGRLAYHLNDNELLIALAIVIVLTSVGMGLAGNALLYWGTRQKLQKALTVTSTLAEANEWLQRHAPTRKRLYIIAGVNGALVLVSLLSWLQMPFIDGVPTSSLPVASPAPTNPTPNPTPTPLAPQQSTSAPPPALPLPETAPTPAPTTATVAPPIPAPAVPEEKTSEAPKAPTATPVATLPTRAKQAPKPAAPVESNDRPALVSDAARQARERVLQLNVP